MGFHQLNCRVAIRWHWHSTTCLVPAAGLASLLGERVQRVTMCLLLSWPALNPLAKLQCSRLVAEARGCMVARARSQPWGPWHPIDPHGRCAMGFCRSRLTLRPERRQAKREIDARRRRDDDTTGRAVLQANPPFVPRGGRGKRNANHNARRRQRSSTVPASERVHVVVCPVRVSVGEAGIRRKQQNANQPTTNREEGKQEAQVPAMVPQVRWVGR